MSYVCSHCWISICIHHLALLTRESFLCARHYASGQAAQFSGLPEPCPAHRQSLLTSTGPRARLRLTHLHFVLMSTKPLAATQMELTEYSPYFEFLDHPFLTPAKMTCRLSLLGVMAVVVFVQQLAQQDPRPQPGSGCIYTAAFAPASIPHFSPKPSDFQHHLH